MKKAIYSAALLMAAALSGEAAPPITYKRREMPKIKGEAPKCKSCKHFYRNGKYNCYCDLKSYYNAVSPMQMACAKYERKKRK